MKRAVSYHQVYGYVESEPKTARSRREIMLAAFVVDILTKHQKQQEEQKCAVSGDWADKNLVFTNATGDFYIPSTLVKVFKRFLVSIGLPHMRFHDLRHSAATILLTMKVHPKVVQEILGHSQITTTMNIYSHAMPSMQSDATEQWDSAFGKALKRGNRCCSLWLLHGCYIFNFFREQLYPCIHCLNLKRSLQCLAQ